MENDQLIGNICGGLLSLQKQSSIYAVSGLQNFSALNQNNLCQLLFTSAQNYNSTGRSCFMAGLWSEKDCTN
jgi:hypothetical protein